MDSLRFRIYSDRDHQPQSTAATPTPTATPRVKTITNEVASKGVTWANNVFIEILFTFLLNDWLLIGTAT